MARVKQVANPAPIQVRGSEVHGKGVFAARQIKKGERIVEYLGERVSHDEADRRYEEKDENDSHTFLFIVDSKTVIDAGTDGNDARYFNHSCDPNCESVVENRRVFIEALRTIEPGEEMTYDYQIYREEGDPENIDEVFACRCGFPQCRGTMLWPPEPKKKKKKKSKANGQSKSKSGGRDKSTAAGKSGKTSAGGKQGKSERRSAAGKEGKSAKPSAAGKQGKSGKASTAGKSGKAGKTSAASKTVAASKRSSGGKSSGAGKKSAAGGKSAAVGKSVAAAKSAAAGKRSGPGIAAQKSGPAKSASKAGKKSVRRR